VLSCRECQYALYLALCVTHGELSRLETHEVKNSTQSLLRMRLNHDTWCIKDSSGQGSSARLTRTKGNAELGLSFAHVEPVRLEARINDVLRQSKDLIIRTDLNISDAISRHDGSVDNHFQLIKDVMMQLLFVKKTCGECFDVELPCLYKYKYFEEFAY
jgi:hypothetical protein